MTAPASVQREPDLVHPVDHHRDGEGAGTEHHGAPLRAVDRAPTRRRPVGRAAPTRRTPRTRARCPSAGCPTAGSTIEMTSCTRSSSSTSDEGPDGVVVRLPADEPDDDGEQPHDHGEHELHPHEPLDHARAPVCEGRRIGRREVRDDPEQSTADGDEADQPVVGRGDRGHRAVRVGVLGRDPLAVGEVLRRGGVERSTAEKSSPGDVGRTCERGADVDGVVLEVDGVLRRRTGRRGSAGARSGAPRCRARRRRHGRAPGRRCPTSRSRRRRGPPRRRRRRRRRRSARSGSSRRTARRSPCRALSSTASPLRARS